MVRYQLLYTKQAQKDAKKLTKSGLKNNAEKILKLLADQPYKNPPRFEKLVGDLDGAFSRRINVQHRIVYEILEEKKIIKIIRMWTHYE
jgi:toxin YoeB